MSFILFLFFAPFFILFLFIFFCVLYSESRRERKEKELERYRKEELEKQRAEKVRLERQKVEDERKSNLANFRKNVFSLSCKNPDVQDIWSNWENTAQNFHDSDMALLEQSKAIFEAVVYLVDRNQAQGVFGDAHYSILYETTLSRCTCSYFTMYKVPCCHMYRLFLILSGNENPDPRISSVDPDLLKALYSISADERLHYISELKYANRYGRNCLLDHKMKREIKLGLWVQSEPHLEPLLNRMTKDKILITLSKSGVSGFSRSWSKVRLVDWVITEHKELLQFMFNDYACITHPDSAFDLADGIASYRDAYPHQHILNWTDALILDCSVSQPYK